MSYARAFCAQHSDLTRSDRRTGDRAVNCLRCPRKPRWTQRAVAALVVSFLFGLVHGFGFAGALAEVGLPPSGLLSALVGFNLGVEAGQMLIVAVLLPLLVWLQRFPWEPRLAKVSSTAIMAAGLLLLAERTLIGNV